MKLPFTYRSNLFGTILMGSVILHGTLFMPGGLFSPKPQFSVEQAPASMEVVLIKQEPEPEKIQEPKNVITAREVQGAVPEVEQKEIKPKEVPKPKIEKPVYIPPARGAVERTKPAYFKNPAPVYPYLARQNSWEGLVLLQVYVQKDGIPSEVKVKATSGYKVLDEAAVKAVQKWQFSPARIGAVAFSTWIDIPIRFSLIEENE